MTPDAKKNRLLFEGFIKSKLPAGGVPSNYTRSLDNKIKRFYTEKMGQEYQSLYELTDVNDVYRIKRDLASHPSMVYRPGRQGDSRMEGLDLYLEYLNSKRHKITTSEKMPMKPTVNGIRMATPKMEGKHIKKERTIIQRNPDARKQCIEHFGCKCAACGIVMSDKYGEIGVGFIEVHHLNPIHLFNASHQVDFLTDLIPLCPNCHAMIHKLEDPGDIEGLKQMIEENESLHRT